MRFEAIEHIPNSSYSYAVAEDKLVIRIRCLKNDIKKCTLYYGDRVCVHQPIIVHEIEMQIAASDKFFDYFQAEFHSPYTRVCYYFKLDDGENEIYYCGREFSKKPPEDRTLYFQFPFIRREEIVDTPEWVKKAIMYQIFPDSFATSKNHIEGSAKTVNNDFNEVSYSMNGGTITGITENLDYLIDLGINCLYITPIFTAEQWHKYDTIDYFSIDPCFGKKEDLAALVKKCHENNIKVLLDGVFNHSGWKFFAFKDLLINGENSKYKHWYYDVKFPIKYEGVPSYQCFAYVKEMPKLNTSNPDVVNYFMKVAKYWIEETDIDGWRLDVANEIDHDFWRRFRNEVKSIKKDAFLVAEIWEDAQDWLKGDQFDSTMNYKFSTICTEYFAEDKISTQEFDYKVNDLLMRYTYPVTMVQMNLLDSHDVTRFLSRCKGDLKRFKLAVLFQMMFLGIPSIFYGDEKGLMGTEEKDYRRPMLWGDNEVSIELHEYYKNLISIRKKYIDTFMGCFSTLAVDDKKNVYIFKRENNGTEIIVALNKSSCNQCVELKLNKNMSALKDLITGRESSFTGNIASLELEAVSGKVFLLK